MDEKGPQKQSMWHRLGLRRWLGRDDRETRNNPPNRDVISFPHNLNLNLHSRASSTDSAKHDNLTRRLSRRVGVGLPRSTTFKRQNSEHRDRLAPLDPEPRRAQSADRRPLSAQRTRSPPPAVGPRLSAPEVQWLGPTLATTVDEPLETATLDDTIPDSEPEDWDRSPDLTALKAPVPDHGHLEPTLEMELEQKWILNLSMHFRDRSEREKFFVTYAETPTRWRRVTISCDYRGAVPDSLEQDLKELRYQRDKCARIYESIRDSLPEIQFYDTVTNLKVETRDGRLHVHVTEDVNETIPYPPISSIGHLRGARCVPESFLHFDNHLSGFVYKVRLGGHAYIKKEIPGPDTVDEFLYEINALHALNRAPNVIQVEAIVVDERQEVVKGLLINYATKGALVDILYDHRGEISFARRERWAKQIVQGLCEIHESGYVQGDFTLSNIVVDGDDNAHIIDINRRGCPVGWEPPEIAAKIESNQRISMYIGVKTDLYQLGMTLWALAMEEDEPERQPRPLLCGNDIEVPDYDRRVVDICLSSTPRHRLSAKDLLSFFPRDLLSRPLRENLQPLVTKTNGVDHVKAPVRPFDHSLSKPHPHDNGLSHHFFSNHHDQGKGSTPTLAGSNGGAAGFHSRHSSTSTLNHHDYDDHPHPHPHQQRLDSGNHYNSRPANPQYAAWEDNLHTGQRNLSVSPPSVGQPSIDLDSFSGNGHVRTNSESTDSISANNDTQPHSSNLHSDSQGAYENPEQEVQQYDPSAVPFLFHSILPINPALPISQRRTFRAMTQETPPPSSSGSGMAAPRPPSFHLLEHLSDSRLPINPALVDESYTDIPDTLDSDLVQSENQISEPETVPFVTRDVIQESVHPIEQETFATPKGVHLVDSRLPINPALVDEGYADIPDTLSGHHTQSFNETSETEAAPSITRDIIEENAHPLQQETLTAPKGVHLLESQLPINPALVDEVYSTIPNTLPSGPAQPVSQTSETEAFPFVTGEPIEEQIHSLNQKPAVLGHAVLNHDEQVSKIKDLLESRLPINPTLMEENRMTVSNVSNDLLESRLPLNPAVAENLASSMSQYHTLTPTIDESVKSVSSLLESELPINPASRLRV